MLIPTYRPDDPRRIHERAVRGIELRYLCGDDGRSKPITIRDWIDSPRTARDRQHNLIVALVLMDVQLGYYTIEPDREHDGTAIGAALAAQREPCNRLVVRRGDGPIRSADIRDMDRLQDEIRRKFGMRFPGNEFTAVLKTLGFMSAWNPSLEDIRASWRPFERREGGAKQ